MAVEGKHRARVRRVQDAPLNVLMHGRAMPAVATSLSLATMSLSLPVELILLILSHIDKKADREAVKSLALTASTFVTPCQSVLFSHISFTSPNSGRRLLDLFSASPWFATYVNRVTINDASPDTRDWLQADLNLVEVLRKLNLKEIRGFTLSRQIGASWEALSPPVRRIIVDICKSPALIDLDLLWAPVALVDLCGPSLKQLRLFQCSAGAAGDVTPIPHRPDIVLNSLELWSNSDAVARFFLDPSSRVQLHAVQTLEVQMYTVEDHYRLLSLMERCRRSLQTLSFRPSPDIASAFSLSCLFVRLAQRVMQAERNTCYRYLAILS